MNLKKIKRWKSFHEIDIFKNFKEIEVKGTEHVKHKQMQPLRNYQVPLFCVKASLIIFLINLGQDFICFVYPPGPQVQSSTGRGAREGLWNRELRKSIWRVGCKCGLGESSGNTAEAALFSGLLRRRRGKKDHHPI